MSAEEAKVTVYKQNKKCKQKGYGLGTYQVPPGVVAGPTWCCFSSQFSLYREQEDSTSQEETESSRVNDTSCDVLRAFYEN
jgi:hypothetical protein